MKGIQILFPRLLMISLDIQNSDKKVTTSGRLIKTKCSKGLTTEKTFKKCHTQKKSACDTLNLKSVSTHATLIIIIVCHTMSS